MKYRANVSTVKWAPSLRWPVRCHCSAESESNRRASVSAATGISAATVAGSCSP